MTYVEGDATIMASASNTVASIGKPLNGNSTVVTVQMSSRTGIQYLCTRVYVESSNQVPRKSIISGRIKMILRRLYHLNGPK